MKNRIAIFAILWAVTACKEIKKEEKLSEHIKPNIVYILADDLGYGDLSFTGQTKFETPNIDRLARQGLFFTQHYSGATVCAPSRSALMTGLHTGHTPVRGNKEVQPEGQWPLPAETITLAERLQQKGYTTGAFGKWGLGYPGSEGDPLNQGFDRFYGYNCQRLGHNYYPYYLWDNDKKQDLKENEGLKKGQYAPLLIHEQALSFIETYKERPFFLYYPSIIPHAELVAPKKYMDQYQGEFEPEKPFEGKDGGEGYRQGPYESQENPHAAFAAMVTLLDDQVGEIMSKLDELGLAENTLVIFTSDNGPHLEGGADPDYFDSNGPFRGYKRDLYEGGIHVPMIARWKGKIKENSKTNHVSAFWDIMPTLLDAVDGESGVNGDGISFLPTLLGRGNQAEHKSLYWEFHEKGGRQALRKGDWKLVRYNVDKNGPYELYDLSNDPGETKDLARQMPDKVSELSKILESSRTPSEIFQFGQNAYQAEP
ncbi:arylsulfatase [Pareuzebyella sediminis]|uniref:arylsulfatase n=1 Tax=Pareuzebyella sediminis TaxID=2607998 RepID=UPI0011F06D9C|nr:arylsulfatase [Pareuzebyella sediminis]